jgi:hypothetical protein
MGVSADGRMGVNAGLGGSKGLHLRTEVILTPLIVLIIVLDRLPFFAKQYADTPIRQKYIPPTPTDRHALPTPPSSRARGKSGRSPCRSVDPVARYGSA